MKMIYQVEDKPPKMQVLMFAIQQILTVVAGVIAVPMIVGNNLKPSAALFGAGAGTLVYMIFTKRKSPVFLGSNFSFVKPMVLAFAGGISMALGYLGLIVGASLAALVYVLLSIVVKFCGTKWIDRFMPAAVIGPTVALIGLTLSPVAVSNLVKGGVSETVSEYSVSLANGQPEIVESLVQRPVASLWVALLCGLIAFIVSMIASVYGKKSIKLLPFLIGILVSYFVATIFTVIGMICGIEELLIIDFNVFKDYMFAGGISINTFFTVPEFVFTKALGAFDEMSLKYFLTIFFAFVPVAFVGFAEHIADHKNLSHIIERDLLENPGLSRTLLGDGFGSVVGAFFGGASNTTYGESISCVAFSRNASAVTTAVTSIGCIALSFLTPLVAFMESIPSCIMGGVCIGLYGFICVSGFVMIQSLDFNKNKNIYLVSAVLVVGVGGLELVVGDVNLTEIAVALILGIICNLIVGKSEE